MERRRRTIHTSSRQYVVCAVHLLLLTGCKDTPWDQPTANSPEYEAYLTGELLRHDPWTRLSKPTLCECTPRPPMSAYWSIALLRKMLTVDAAQRITLQSITQHRWFLRHSNYLDSKGLCRNAIQLAIDLQECMPKNDLIQQATSSESRADIEMCVATPSTRDVKN